MKVINRNKKLFDFNPKIGERFVWQGIELVTVKGNDCDRCYRLTRRDVADLCAQLPECSGRHFVTLVDAVTHELLGENE